MQHIWIFQLAASPAEEAKAQILQELDAFVAVWKAHGSPVPGSAALRYERFVIVQAEPGHASGCSIDSMTKGVTEILNNHSIVVLGAERVFFKEGNGAIADIDFKEVKAAILAGRLSADSTVFDSTMGQSNDLDRWEVSLHSTWMGRFLPQRA